ncbi:MAG UNVERIFIED_CONTAM: type IV secretion system protein [Planctomycetaceae bacterium]
MIDRADSSFYQFQTNMQRAVMAFLTLYVMFVGFKIVMGGEAIPKSGEAIMYAVKLILVIYFSVGLNVRGEGARFDGMIDLVFPLLFGAANEISTWVMNATPSGLCKFLPSEYPPDMGHIALWDALDCKLLHYLGIDAIMTLWQGQNSSNPLGFSIPPYVYLLIPSIYFKQINLVILCLSYPLLVLSLAAYLVNSFVVCMIAITILGILAPIFVPMSLFKFTQSYFESWYTLMISFVLQPVVVIGFMTLMFSLYDQGFYGSCKYVPLTIKTTSADGGELKKKLFIIDNDKANYESEEDYKGCQESIGWILNNPLGSLAAKIAATANDGKTINMSSVPEERKKMADYIRQFGALSGVTPVVGFFFGYFSLLSQMSWTMIVNLMICCLLLYLMYELSSQLGQFAADIAQSVTLSGSIGPRSVSDKAKEAFENAQGANKPKRDEDEGKDSENPAPKRGGAGEGGDDKKNEGDKDNPPAPKLSPEIRRQCWRCK